MEAPSATNKKRKDLDHVNGDFSDLSHSSPALKIRRLEAELHPVMEDDDPEIVMSFEHPSPEVQRAPAGPVIEELPPSSSPVNKEMAIVLFKPIASLLLHQQLPSTFSVSVDPYLISEFKNDYLWASLCGSERSSDDDPEAADNNRNQCMAVVPWVANQFNPTPGLQVEAAEEMEAEETGEARMEIEDSSTAATVQEPPDQYGEIRRSHFSGLPQRQHCLTPQLPHTTSSPIVWFRQIP